MICNKIGRFIDINQRIGIFLSLFKEKVVPLHTRFEETYN